MQRRTRLRHAKKREATRLTLVPGNRDPVSIRLRIRVVPPGVWHDILLATVDQEYFVCHSVACLGYTTLSRLAQGTQ
jgi:hypothetical protein